MITCVLKITVLISCVCTLWTEHVYVKCEDIVVCFINTHLISWIVILAVSKRKAYNHFSGIFSALWSSVASTYTETDSPGGSTDMSSNMQSED